MGFHSLPGYPGDGPTSPWRKANTRGLTHLRESVVVKSAEGPTPDSVCSDGEVLHLIDHSGLGGAQRVVAGITRSHDRSVAYALREKGSDETGLTSFGGEGKYELEPFVTAYRYLQTHNVDVVHAHLKKATLVGAVLKLLSPDIRFVVHEHGEVMLDSWWYPRSLRLVGTVADRFVAVSDATKDTLCQRTPVSRSNVETIHNFVDLSKFNPTALEETESLRPGRFDDAFVVGFAGRIVDLKGWRDIVELAEATREMSSEMRFLVAGAGEESTLLKEELRTRGLEDRVSYLGFVDSIIDFYKSIDCFVMPSRIEPMGLAHLEAQAVGVPVVVSSAGGIPETVDHRENAMVYDPGDVGTLRSHVSELGERNGELYSQLREGGLDNVRDFSIETYVQSLSEFYDSLG